MKHARVKSGIRFATYQPFERQAFYEKRYPRWYADFNDILAIWSPGGLWLRDW